MGGLSLLANLAIVHIIMQIALNFHRKKNVVCNCLTRSSSGLQSP